MITANHAHQQERRSQQEKPVFDLRRFTDDVLSTLNVEDIYTDSSHQFKVSGNKHRGGCPFHDSSSGSSFVVSKDSLLFWCEGCRQGGSAIDYLYSRRAGRWSKPRGLDFIETLKQLGVLAEMPLPPREQSPKEIEVARKWESRRTILEAVAEHGQKVLWSERGVAARRYLIEERKLTEDKIRDLGLGLYFDYLEVKQVLADSKHDLEDAKDAGVIWSKLEGYILFPWLDSRGRPLTIYGRYQTKTPPEGKPKTIALPGSGTKASPLYLDRSLKAGHKDIILVEGVLDAALLQAAGDTRVCAYVAASCSEQQIETLKRHHIESVTLCGDPDNGGENGTLSNVERISKTGIPVYVAPKLPDGLDPDEFLIRDGIDGWNRHIKNATHGYTYKACSIVKSVGLEGNLDDKDKHTILQRAISFSKTVMDTEGKLSLSTFFWPAICEALEMDLEEIKRQLEEVYRQDNAGSPDSVSDHSSKVVQHPTAKRQFPLTEEELECRIDELLNQNLEPSKLTSKLNLLARETDFLSSSEVKRIYYERLAEHEQVDSRQERVFEVDELLKVGSLSLKLADELPAIYAEPLTKLSWQLNLREEVYLLALLTGVSTCHRSGTELIIQRSQGFSVPLNLFSGIVAESGQRKSPVIKAIITKPLQVLQREAKAEHKAAIAKYEEDLERWNNLKGEEREDEFPDGKPQDPPQQKIYFFTSTSGSESINRQVDAHPDQPLLYLKDELMGIFTQQGKYSQGRGSEKQDFLSYYDGTGSTELLADGVRSDTETILMSIFGSVQPEILRKFTKDCSDPDGQWARFLWVNQPLTAATLQDDDGGNIDITDLLAGLYRRVCALPVIKYTLSREGFKLYQKVYSRLEQLRVNCPDPGLRAVYSKLSGQFGRLIANCHIIHELAAGQEVLLEEIPLERVKQGVRLINFFMDQVKILRSDSDAAKGELPDILKKIIQLSQRLGKIKAKQVQQNYESIKLTPDKIRDAFLELEVMGYGVTNGKGNRLEWEYNPDSRPSNESGRQTVGAVGGTVGETPTEETTTAQDFQGTVGEIGAVGDFSKNTNQKETTPFGDLSSSREISNLFGKTPISPTVLSNQGGAEVSAPTVSPTAPTVSPTTAPTVFQDSTEVAIAPKVGDTVCIPNGQLGVVEMVYPDGQLGVTYNGGLRFAMWEPSQLMVVSLNGD